MGKYKRKLRKRGGRHGAGPDRRDHFGSDGRPKKRMTAGVAAKLAKERGMNYYHCTTCGGFHIGRTSQQVEGDAGLVRPHRADE